MTQVSHAQGRVHIQAEVTGQAKVKLQVLVGAKGNPRIIQKTAAVVANQINQVQVRLSIMAVTEANQAQRRNC